MTNIFLTDVAGSSDYESLLPPQVVTGPPVNGIPQNQWMPPVLMVAIQELYQVLWSQRLPNVQPGSLFWARYNDAVLLLAVGMAVIAPAGSSLAPEPPYSVNGSPGVAAGTSNASH
ncbi:MAG: hypothetical protein ACRDOK_04610 [Streptosporangiaceae bacterium]